MEGLREDRERWVGLGQLEQGGIAFWRIRKEVERTQVAELAGVGENQLDEERGGLWGAETPDDIAAACGIPIALHFAHPGVKALIIVADGTDAQGFEVPAIYAVMQGGELGPDFGALSGVVQRDG